MHQDPWSVFVNIEEQLRLAGAEFHKKSMTLLWHTQRKYKFLIIKDILTIFEEDIQDISTIRVISILKWLVSFISENI